MNPKSDVKNITGTVLSDVTIELAKQIPGLSILIEGLRSYKNTIEENQRIQFLRSLEERIEYIQKYVKIEWYATVDGREFLQKLVAAALNAENIDKINYFVNMLLNSTTTDIQQIEKVKFIEMTAHLSKAALTVLAAANKIHTGRGPRYSRQIDGPSSIKEIIEITGFSDDLVSSCINELYSEGTFNSIEFSTGTAAFRPITERFVNFLNDPN